MVLCLTRLMACLHQTHTISRPSRGFCVTAIAAKKKVINTRTPPLSRLEEVVDGDEVLYRGDWDIEDAASAGHLLLQQHRETLYYLRLIEHQLPQLVAFRKSFKPPMADTPVMIRSLDYCGEEHPATSKRVLVVAVDDLPLQDDAAIHTIKLLAGPRWTPNPPADAGVSGLELWGNGYIKISCEKFPKPAMNIKWASDALDRLIIEANKSKDEYQNAPLDLRHIYSKARKAKRGDHIRNRVLNRPSILDFPEEWLPPIPMQIEP